MAEYQGSWGSSKTSKEVLEEYWDKLLEEADYNEEEEIKFFLHCTTLTGKKGILKSGSLLGGWTGLPARAPLASYDEMKGIWLAMSTKDLPTRSPYGSQRMVFRVRDIMTYTGLESNGDQSDNDSDDKWDAPVNDDTKPKGGKGQRKTKERKKKSREVNRKQKECYLKHKIPEKIRPTLPSLFFECAHFYGDSQYVRLLLVRPSDPKIEWCREMCKEIDIEDNPFFQFLSGRLYTHRRGERGNMFIEVLVVGDIVFDQLLEPPSWDEVGTMSRAGFDPRLGVCDK